MWNYKIGSVVREKDGSAGGFFTGKDATPMFGHIVGFDRIEWDSGYETILKVQWDDGTTRSIHPGNVLHNG